MIWFSEKLLVASLVLGYFNLSECKRSIF